MLISFNLLFNLPPLPKHYVHVCFRCSRHNDAPSGIEYTWWSYQQRNNAKEYCSHRPLHLCPFHKSLSRIPNFPCLHFVLRCALVYASCGSECPLKDERICSKYPWAVASSCFQLLRTWVVKLLLSQLLGLDGVLNRRHRSQFLSQFYELNLIYL